MKKEEMQNLVNTLAAERKIHIDTIENLTLNNIKTIVRTIASNLHILAYNLRSYLGNRDYYFEINCTFYSNLNIFIEP